MEDSEWLESLKVGDEVYTSRTYGQAPVLNVVSRLTEKMVIITVQGATKPYEQRYWKKDGWCVGHNAFNGSFLIQPSDEVREKVEIEKLKFAARQLRDQLAIPSTIAELKTFIEAVTPLVKGRACPEKSP